MIIRKNADQKRGIMFAIWPRWTPDGWACLEWLLWERIPSWGWGSGDTYRYTRYATNVLFDDGSTTTYATPPDPKRFCKNYRADGPTPCHYPHCRYRDEDGITIRCGVDKVAFGEN